MLRQFSTKRVLAFFFLDWLGTLCVLLLTVYWRVGLEKLPQPFLAIVRALPIPLGSGWGGVQPRDILAPQVLVFVGLIWPLFFIVFGVYDGRRSETLKAQLLNVFVSVCAAGLSLAGLLYLTYRETPRTIFVAFIILDLASLFGTRMAWWAFRRLTRHRYIHRSRVLMVGAGRVGCRAVEQLRDYAGSKIELVGYVDDDSTKQGQEFESLPVLGTLDQVADIVKAHHIENAVIALPMAAHERLADTCFQLQELSVHVHVIPDLFALSFPGATLDGFGSIPVIDLGQPGIYGWRRFWKRVFDVTAVVAGLLISWPLMMLITIAIKLDSPGPVFFRQERIGEHSRPFKVFKFRSMKIGNDPSLHKAHVTRLIQQNVKSDEAGRASLKMKDDSRITRVGCLIRKTSLDELPQMFNVLLGEMSLVGPRPSLEYEVAVYREWHKRRLEAIPGITGLWQVKGRNRVSFDDMVHMDLEYIERQSLWLDIWILLQTPKAVIGGRGAG